MIYCSDIQMQTTALTVTVLLLRFTKIRKPQGNYSIKLETNGTGRPGTTKSILTDIGVGPMSSKNPLGKSKNVFDLLLVWFQSVRLEELQVLGAHVLQPRGRYIYDVRYML